MSATPYPAAPVQQAEDPGKTLGIVGLVLSFVTSLPGLIVSIIAVRKSKAAGFSNTIAKVGIVVGAVITAFYLAIAAVGIVGVIALGQKCADLGPGVHQSGGTTITCG
ncbi:MAG: hypothetical protein J2P23_12205 [Microlunatus sp.]|nr:hypothetical protein [Microlunatus sp.]